MHRLAGQASDQCAARHAAWVAAHPAGLLAARMDESCQQLPSELHPQLKHQQTKTARRVQTPHVVAQMTDHQNEFALPLQVAYRLPDL